MDCYSAESQFIGSLDFLCPPVKRIKSREAFSSNYNNEANDVHLLRGLRNKFVRQTPSDSRNTQTIKTTAESSTSLILQKTSERQILEHYSIVSYTSLNHQDNDTSSLLKSDRNQNILEKPLIKVTVIPKTDQIQTAKLLRRRKHTPKRVQSTASNHENSIQTKNVYLIVAGRRREKIYEIKTTGSAKFSTDHDSYSKDEEIPIKELSNFKHLIHSLDMDRKEMEDATEQMGKPEAPQQTSFEWKGFPDCKNCVCGNDSNEMPKKSRVRIFGQFGISKDDKYVLRYGASVNDQPVLTDVAQLTRDSSPVIATTPYGTMDGQSAKQKDSCIQANYNYDLDVEKPVVTSEVPSKESQGTQVNFNAQLGVMKGKYTTFSDKKIQCNCCEVQTRSEHNTIKDCQSPLVIISVYPKQSPHNIVKNVPSPIENTRSLSPVRMTTYTSNQMLKTDKTSKKPIIDPRRNYKSPTRSRSPSPIKKASRSKVPEDMAIKAQDSERRSPDRQKALTAIKQKIQEKDKLKHDASARKLPLKFNTSNGTQVSRNIQNFTVSNATQVSKKIQQMYTLSNATQVSNKNQQLYTVSDGTQVSGRKRDNYTKSNATQYSNGPQSLAATQYDTVDSRQEIAPVKHSRNTPSIRRPQNKSSPLTRPQTSHVSHETQVQKNPQFFESNATQVSVNEPVTMSNATQVSKNHKNYIASRITSNRNQETYNAPAQIFKHEETLRFAPKLKAETGTNTDHARTKKAIVETYTKKLTEQMNQKELITPKLDSSKVTINIDGDKEYYDVMFNQDKTSTGLTIRKTLKDMGSQKDNEDECFPSLENLLYLPDCAVEKGVLKPEKKSPTTNMSIALNNNRSEDELPLAQHVSRITIRDSLEISHRREDKSNHNNLKNTQTCFTAQFTENVQDDTEFLAPIKHFIGDDCSLSDPIARDKQIRELLGVDKTKSSFATTKQARCCEKDDRIPYQCIYRQQCKKSQVTEINFEFQNLCPCFKPSPSYDTASMSVQCRHADCAKTSVQCRHVDCAQTSVQCRVAEAAKKKVPCRNVNCENTPVMCRHSDCENAPVMCRHEDCGKASKQSEHDKNRNPKKNLNILGKGFLKGGNKNKGDNEKSSIYQQLILNRNIQVFLQVEQFCKQKPIVLSKKQYNKVKKTIQKTISMKKSSHDKRRSLMSERREDSEVSVGEVRSKKTKDINLPVDKDTQTDNMTCYSEENCRNKSVCRKTKPGTKRDMSDHSIDHDADRGTAKLKKIKKDTKNKEFEETSPAERLSNRKGDQNVTGLFVDHNESTSESSDEEEDIKEKCKKLKGRLVDRQTETEGKNTVDEVTRDDSLDQLIAEKKERLNVVKKERLNGMKKERLNGEKKEQSHRRREHPRTKGPENARMDRDNPTEDSIQQKEAEIETFVLFNAENTRDNLIDTKETDYDARTRKTTSSLEIRYASIAYKKQVAYSSTDVGALSDSSIAHVNSFHTIFRGHRKSATPNLGASAYSLYSEDACNSENKSAKFIMEPRDSKPKKPFLRRLMSCLVMRSNRDSELKIPIGPTPEPPCVNSSIDSYHISTSLGAMEISSSIYDTSASFYSNHTILPVNSKIKRGFFSSMRGFLTNRKS